ARHRPRRVVLLAARRFGALRHALRARTRAALHRPGMANAAVTDVFTPQRTSDPVRTRRTMHVRTRTVPPRVVAARRPGGADRSPVGARMAIGTMRRVGAVDRTVVVTAARPVRAGPAVVATAQRRIGIAVATVAVTAIAE